MADFPELAPLILTETDPASIHAIVPRTVSEAISRVPKEYLHMEQRELRKLVCPGMTIEAVRTAFWLEYNTCVFQGQKRMNMQRVYGGICHAEYFFGKIITSPLLMAWILTPPQNYVAKLESYLEFTLDKIYEVIDLPLLDKKGRVDHKAATLIMKAHEMIEHRVRGTPVQRSVTAHLNDMRNVGATLNTDKLDITEKSLNERIAVLRRREREATGRLAELSGPGLPDNGGSGEGEATKDQEERGGDQEA